MGGSRPQALITGNKLNIFFLPGRAPPTSSYLSSAIPNRRPSVKDIIGYVKKKILLIHKKDLLTISYNNLY